tara:strand:+ start:41 stop:331 length:291 start_codon:yes stop_codon:yes gene_type:complete
MIKQLSIFAITIASTFAIPVEPAQAGLSKYEKTIDGMCKVANKFNKREGESVRPGTLGGHIYWAALQEYAGTTSGSYTNVWKLMKSVPTSNCRAIW